MGIGSMGFRVCQLDFRQQRVNIENFNPTHAILRVFSLLLVVTCCYSVGGGGYMFTKVVTYEC